MGVKPDHLGSAKWKKQRLRVLNRDAWLCAYCGKDATQVDHVAPRADGGGDDLDNLVASCTLCNLRKGRRSVFLMRPSTPLVFTAPLSPNTTSLVPRGPFDGQSQDRRVK